MIGNWILIFGRQKLRCILHIKGILKHKFLNIIRYTLVLRGLKKESEKSHWTVAIITETITKAQSIRLLNAWVVFILNLYTYSTSRSIASGDTLFKRLSKPSFRWPFWTDTLVKLDIKNNIFKEKILSVDKININMIKIQRLSKD